MKRAWNRIFRRAGRGLVLLGAVLAASTLAGCGGGKTAPVTGKVTYNGKPVTGGTVSFTPIANGEREPGKPAAGEVQADGTYRLSTYGTADGAVVGKHKVAYSAPIMPYPPGKEPRPGVPPPRSGFEGLTPKQSEVEVKSGKNPIDVELVPGGAIPARR